MNQRNVEALAGILRDLTWRNEYPEDRLLALAETLAALGVLAPSALTEAEADVLSDGRSGRANQGTYDLRDHLERIAKGEAS